MFERNTAASTGTPTPAPPSSEIPITADSGMPSRTAPSISAFELASAPSGGPSGLIRPSPPPRAT